MAELSLNEKFQKLTGLNHIKIEDMINEASSGSDEEQQKTYDFIYWNIKHGLILDMPKFKELYDDIISAISSLNKKSTIEDITEDNIYTAEEAAEYNATLDGAVSEGDEKTAAIPEVLYTAETAAEHNATLDGAVNEGDIQTPAVPEVLYTAEDEEVIAGSKEVGDVKTAAVPEVLYTAETAAEYNATLDGAVSEGDIQTPAVPATVYTQEEADAYNAELPGAVKEGDTKQTYTITFKNGEEIVKTITGVTGTQVSAPNVTKEGYEFNGWSIDGETPILPVDTIYNNDIVYTALWIQS